LQHGLTYNDTVVRQFAIMTVVWGVVGMLVSLLIAAQLAGWTSSPESPKTGYGRLAAAHSNAVIFAFGCCGLMGGASLSRGAANEPPPGRLFFRQAGCLRLLGLANWSSWRRISLPAGLHTQARIR
jgi:hypothetical protein